MKPDDFLKRAWAELPDAPFPNEPLLPLCVALRAIELAQAHENNRKDFLAKALMNAARTTANPA